MRSMRTERAMRGKLQRMRARHELSTSWNYIQPIHSEVVALTYTGGEYCMGMSGRLMTTILLKDEVIRFLEMDLEERAEG